MVVDEAAGTNESDMFWKGFVESGAGEVYAFGTYERVAHRQGDVLFVGQQVSSTSWSTGTQELLLLSNFSISAAFASSNGLVWLAGFLRTGSILSAGAVYCVVR